VAERTRSFSWQDPMTLAAQAGELTGLVLLERVGRGELPPPPIAALLGMEFIEVKLERVVFALEPAEWMFNPIGSVHGGVAATLLDTALGCAVHTRLPAGTGYATTDLHIRYLRTMNARTGRVIATGTVVHAGSRQSTAEGRLEVEATGKLIATATSGCIILGPA
jgi:uncharacterized protein (TIGR00369 family)